MVKTRSKLMSWVLLLAMMFTVLAGTLTVHADAYENLMTEVRDGQYVSKSTGKVLDYQRSRYAKEGGGYLLFSQVWNAGNATFSQSQSLFCDDFQKLKTGARQQFVTDLFTLANAVASDTVAGYYTGTNGITDSPTDDTVEQLLNVLQYESGMGSTMLSSLLANTKPNYVAANRFYEPFSGVVGTILGVISVLLMAALGITMALDLAYITIPAMQMALGGTDNNGNGDKSKGIGGIISQEAKKAVQAADGGSGGQAGSGEYKAAVGIYFKYRWKGLVILGICLLYLVQGQIYSFVGWFIDLFSGFLGF